MNIGVYHSVFCTKTRYKIDLRYKIDIRYKFYTMFDQRTLVKLFIQMLRVYWDTAFLRSQNKSVTSACSACSVGAISNQYASLQHGILTSL